MPLPPNPLKAFDNLDLRVGILERKQSSAGAGTGVSQALAVQKWKLNAPCSVPTGVWNNVGPMVLVAADSSDTDNAITVTAGPATTQVTVNKDGIYTLAFITTAITSNAVGARVVRWVRNDGVVVADNGPPSSSATPPTRAAAIVTLWATAGTYFNPQYWQNSGSTLSLPADNAGAGAMQAIYVAFHGNKEPKGDQGTAGAQGPAGQGIPTGGAAGQTLVKLSGADYDTQWQTPSAVVSGDEVLISAGVPGAPNFELWIDIDDDTGNPAGGGSTPYMYHLPADTMINATPGTAFGDGLTFMNIQNVTAGWPSVPAELWTYKEGAYIQQDLRTVDLANIVYRRVWQGSPTNAWSPWSSTQNTTLSRALNPARAYSFLTANQSIGTGSWTQLAGLTNKYLKGGMVLGANAFVVPYDGLYHFSGHCYFSSGSAASTRRGVALLRNGVLSHQGLLLVGNIAQTAAALLDLDVELTANDSIGASVFQDSGGSISATAGEFATWFSLRYVSAL